MAHRPDDGRPGDGATGNGRVIEARGRGHRRRLAAAALALAIPFVVSGCAETQLAAHVAASQAPKGQPHYKVGDPYRINGRLYEPRESFDYVATGVASWYGPGFAGRTTANGEIFDPNLLTAAHPTLQLPSIARVTNLQNGRSVEVRINDRGPFASDRVIDVSRRAAELLGFKSQGTAVVRIEVVGDRSLALRAALTGTPLSPAAAPVGPVVIAAAPPAASGPATPVRAEAVGTNGPRSLLPAPARVVRPPVPTPAVVPVAAVLPDVGPAADPPALRADVAGPAVAAAAAGDLYVQVGAFTRRGNADSLRAGLAPLGPAEVSPARLDGVAYYRVRLGPFASRESAAAALESVRAAGHEAARVVGR